jgi:glycerophosphoryl diester phosphodiesterase
MTQIIAHRGSSFLAPENTLAAVELAWQEGADAVEVDVFMTADGQIVALHDEDLRRTGGVDRRIDAMTFADSQAIDVGRWKREQFAGERIPTLAALLDTLRPSKQFLVEIKCGHEIVDELARVVKASKSPTDVVIIGMSLPVMQRAKHALPMCSIHGVIEHCSKGSEVPSPKSQVPSKSANQSTWDLGPGTWDNTTDALIATARQYMLDGVDLDTRGPITAELVSNLKAAGLGIGVWTVDSPQRARELIAAGVEGITTNRPGWLRSELGL